ncbi:hypothetical protein PHPALM_28508 [Phytophthora palmivora]|uniref:Transmembrane protein n=1 Tax=Phytophthora palmivora TaxID=4796 RepID=A0A2P4XA03_9STRA|nr:hypothetical protein PHPALM_28508 [Phytophthora palmivora]
MKVQPVDQAQPIYASNFATLCRWIANWWHRSQIGHRSEYSVERLLAFRDYYKCTSFTRVVAVCILTPLPAITVALLIDCTPLRSPSDGWKANYAFWIRWFFALVAVSVGATAQIREVILPEAISNAEAVAISLGTAITDLSVALALAVTWRFPIPFGYILMVGPYMLILLGFTLMIIGRRLLTESPVLRQQIKSQATIIFAQGAVAMAYPFFTAVFTRLSGSQQTVFVIVTPLFKFITKHIIANAAQGLHEYVGPIVVFSVDVFSVFYVAICMQISKTVVTTLLIIASDSFHVIVALRIISHQANVFESSREEGPSSTMNYLDDLPEMLQHIFDDPVTLSDGHRFRVTAPFPLPLSVERKKSSRKGSTPRRLLMLMNSDVATSANRLRSALLEEAVCDALQVLFHSEYVLMTEYIECVLPMLYAIYLPILFHLPVAQFYPQTASSTPDKVKQDVINIIMFGAVEFVGFVGLLSLLKRKFGISPLYQLAFVLETQVRTVQGHLFVWIVFILHMPLMHYGKFFVAQVVGRFG